MTHPAMLDTTSPPKHPGGRPRGDDPPKVFSFRLTGAESLKLERLAADMGMKPSAYIQRIIQRSLSSRSHHKKKIRLP